MISVRGEQYFDDVDPNATELMTEGTLEQTEDGFLLSYQETELTGMDLLFVRRWEFSLS